LFDDSDALNVLGVASYRAGEPVQARRHWEAADRLGDSVAPLLLRLADDPPLPG
jgi:hypothetical protein